MHRFFLPPEDISSGTVAITGSPAYQIRRVLRLKTGDRIIVLDNSGWQYEVELQEITSSEAKGKIITSSPADGEPRTRITLYQALLKGSNFELVLQKCTEIGVAGFVPVISERCAAGEPNSAKLNRWRSIITEAAEQSKRGIIPVLHSPIRFSEACKTAKPPSLIPWEEERATSIGKALRELQGLRNSPEANIFIGPEGGFSVQEAELARSHGITTVSLGRRILRAETAGLVAATITLYEQGDLDNRRE